MIKSFLTWLKSTEKGGYVLLEIQGSFFVVILIVGLVFGNVLQILQSWHNMLLDAQLNSAGLYMQSFLEKEIGHKSQIVSIEPIYALNTDKIVVHTEKASTCWVYRWKVDKQGLYRETIKADSKGVNPLYVPDCKVVDWHVEKAADNMLIIKFTLEKTGRKKHFQQFIRCLNGEVQVHG